MARSLAIAALIATLAPCPAQTPAFRDALRAGDLARAVAAFEKPVRIDDATERLDLTERLSELVRDEDDPALRAAALRHMAYVYRIGGRNAPKLG